MKKIFLYLSLFLFFACSSSNDEGSGGESISEACKTVTSAVNDALKTYTNSTQSTAKVNCENYRKALESQQIVCGDADGKIQETINALKDCSVVR